CYYGYIIILGLTIDISTKPFHKFIDKFLRGLNHIRHLNYIILPVSTSDNIFRYLCDRRIKPMCHHLLQDTVRLAQIDLSNPDRLDKNPDRPGQSDSAEGSFLTGGPIIAGK